MKNNYLSKLKRTISGILALAMTASLTSVMPATADMPVEPISRTYSGDGYEVRYDITGGWADNRNVQVTLTNTGDEPLQNWALKYDVQGEIVNIWNGTVAASGDDWSIVKNNGYNYDIQPKTSTSFGYIVSGNDSTLPETIELCTERKEVAEDNYTVKLNVDSDWGSGFTGNVEIKAVGDKPIEAWQMSFDTNFEMTSAWNASIINADNNNYTVANTYATAFIQPGETVSFGISGTKSCNVVPEISNISINSVVIDYNSDKTVIDDSSEEENPSDSSDTDSSENDSSSQEDSSSEADNSSESDSSSENDSSSNSEDSEPEEEIEPDEPEPEEEEDSEFDVGYSNDLWVIAYGEYDKTDNAVNIEWYSNVDGEYELFVSDDNTEYRSITDKTANTSYRLAVNKDLDQKYFKVKVSHYYECAYSIPFYVKRTVNGFEVSPLDSDEDGLSDVTELKIGTDLNKADTDDDGLTDIQEFTITFTDPCNPNSVHPNHNDVDADNDADGLSNNEEIARKTNPNKADTDEDGLSDGDEISAYETDPLDPDTDDDGLNDGDEVALGYDPKKANADIKTTITEQHLDKDSKVFAEINTEDNAFDISMDINAAGNAANALTARVSPYADTVSNDAIIGVVPEFSYPDDLSLSKVTLNFGIKDAYTANTNGKYAEVSSDFEGIKRLSVFKYFDEYGMLMPIETTYDTTNNTVKATVDEVGTYCLVDVEKWFDSLEIDPAKFETITLSPSVMGMTGITLSTSLLSAGDEEISEDAKLKNKKIDIIFNAFVYKQSSDIIYDQARLFGETIFDNCDESCSVRIYIVDYRGNLLPYSDYQDYFSSKYEWDNFFDTRTITKNIKSTHPEIDTAIAAFLNNNTLRADADKYYVAIESDHVEHRKIENAADRLLSEEICALIGANGAMDQHRQIAETTGGQFFNKLNTYGVPMAEYIVDFTRRKTDGEVYKTITSTGLKVITLEAPITEDYLAAMRTDVDRSMFADQDEDGLCDFEELRYYIGTDQVISWDYDGKVKLLTFEECMKIVAAESYIEHALTQYKGWDLSFMKDFRILPIKSDPTDADSDNDLAPDGIEKELETDPLSADTDGDGLKDGKEIVLCYDPKKANADNDIYDDRKEYMYGQDPYTYDDDPGDMMIDFAIGFVAGDFCEVESVSQVFGQFTASVLPYVGTVCDIRDLAASIIHVDGKDIVTNIFGLIPGPGDLAKGGATVSKFLVKHADDLPTVVKVVEKVTTKYPRVTKYINISDAVVHSAKNASEGVKLTKRGVVQLQKTAKASGKTIELSKGITDLVEYSQAALKANGLRKDLTDIPDNGDSSGGNNTNTNDNKDNDDGNDDNGDDDNGNDPIAQAISRNKYKELYESDSYKILTEKDYGAFYLYANSSPDIGYNYVANIIDTTNYVSQDVLNIFLRYYSYYKSQSNSSKQYEVFDFYNRTMNALYLKGIMSYSDNEIFKKLNKLEKDELIYKFIVDNNQLTIDKNDIALTLLGKTDDKTFSSFVKLNGTKFGKISSNIKTYGEKVIKFYSCIEYSSYSNNLISQVDKYGKRELLFDAINKCYYPNNAFDLLLKMNANTSLEKTLDKINKFGDIAVKAIEKADEELISNITFYSNFTDESFDLDKHTMGCVAVDLSNGKIYFGLSGSYAFNPTISKKIKLNNVSEYENTYHNLLNDKICVKLSTRIQQLYDDIIKGNIDKEVYYINTYPTLAKGHRIENCAEIWAARNALLDGADFDNLAFRARKTIDDYKYTYSCNNCRETFKNNLVIQFKGE